MGRHRLGWTSTAYLPQLVPYVMPSWPCASCSSIAAPLASMPLSVAPPLPNLLLLPPPRVLIFSQFKIMLDVLEDYVRMCNWPVERIDGSVTGRDRQAAIDRYTNSEGGGRRATVRLPSTATPIVRETGRGRGLSGVGAMHPRCRTDTGHSPATLPSPLPYGHLAATHLSPLPSMPLKAPSRIALCSFCPRGPEVRASRSPSPTLASSTTLTGTR